MRLSVMHVGAGLLAGVLGVSLASAASAQPARHVAMPRYYATVTGQGAGAILALRDSATGRMTGSVRVPGGPLNVTVAAAADDRSFMVGSGTAGPSGHGVYRLFRVRLSAAGVPGRPVPVARVFIPLGGGLADRASVLGTALSPDGSRLAVSVQRFAPSVDTFDPSGMIEVIDLVTGKARTWTAPSVGNWAGPPSWAGPDTVAFAWWRVTFSVFPRVAEHIAGIGRVSTAGGGATLPGTLAPVTAALGIRSVAFAAGSALGVATACVNQPVGGGGRGVVTARLGAIGLTSGQFRILTTQSAGYHDPATRVALLTRCGALVSMDPSGQHALVYGLGFGRLDGSAFTALPGFAAPGSAASAAW